MVNVPTKRESFDEFQVQKVRYGEQLSQKTELFGDKIW
jgi:hypothetical protein